MNNYAQRANRFLKPVSSFLLLCFLIFSGFVFATPTTPTSDFIDNGDGTVTHKTTGLVWMRCSMGQAWDKATASCTGNAATYTWDAAMALKSNFAGKSDWRLPNIAELHTIVEQENYNPRINTAIFPNTPLSYFWSSTPYVGNSDLAWLVDFRRGDGSNSGIRISNLEVRLVRSSLSFGSLPLTTPNMDFTDNNDGTVTHKRTGLVWQRCAFGQTWTGSTCSGTASTVTYANALVLTSTFAGKSDWRLPNQNELVSIVEYGTYNSAINTIIFPNAPNSFVWSSSTIAFYSYDAWGVNFNNGGNEGGWKEYGYPVRLVRGKWSAPSSKLDLTQANCRYVSPIYSQTWQRMKVKKAPSCIAVARYHTWINSIYPQNQIVSSYYDSRLANIDTSNQLLTAYLKHVDDGIAVIDTLLDPDLRRVLTPSKYKLSTQIMKSKGIVQSLKDGRTVFERRNTLGRVLDKTFKEKIVAEGGSDIFCKLFFDGAVEKSCSTEVSKIVSCTEHLVGEGWKGVSGCVLGGITTTVGLMNNALDIFEVINIRKQNIGYILMTDYLHGYFEKGTMVLPSDANLEQAIQILATNMSFSSGDYDMAFVKNGVLDSINRTAVATNNNVRLVEQLKGILNK